MMAILFLILNAAILIQYANLLPRWGITRSAEKYPLAFLLWMVQIITTLLFLGSIGSLYRIPAIAINGVLILSFTFIFRSLASGHQTNPGLQIWKVILRPLSNKLIAFGSVIVLGWLFICAYFLPPRGVDDVTYHLPFIYESIQRGYWALLPTNLRIHFAYPMNVEALYSWPVLIMGNTRWVDACQIFLGLWTAGIIYLFARHFGLRRSKAFFLAGIFFLTPIVIAQMGTNYIDVASAGFLLCSLYLTLRFLTTSNKIYVRLAFLSIGTMMGIKYHLLFAGLALGLVLLFILIRKKWYGDLGAGLIGLAALGLGWHIRNFILFSDWLYPGQATALFGNTGTGSLSGFLMMNFHKIQYTFTKCENNGTVDGGFGHFYGLVILLSWIMGSWIFLFRKHRWKNGETLFFLTALSFLLIIIPIGTNVYQWIGPRILLVAWPLFIITFGRLCFNLNKKKWFHQSVIVLCFFGFAADTVDVVNSSIPHHHWWDTPAGTSEFESYRYSGWYLDGIGPCASALDVITRHQSRQATVFLAAPAAEFLSAPFYGFSLQSKIINFDPRYRGEPDFLVYLTFSNDPFIYIGNYHKSLQEAQKSKYRKIFSNPYGIIFAHPRVLRRYGHSQWIVYF